MRAFLLVFAVTILSSCVPYPHFRTYIEKQSGRVLYKGAPVAGLKVLQSYAFMDKTCAQSQMETTTDQNGRFEFPAHSTFTLVASLAEDHHFSSLCTTFQDKPRWLMFTHTVRESARQESVFICELEEKKVEKPKEKDANGKDKPVKLSFPCALKD